MAPPCSVTDVLSGDPSEGARGVLDQQNVHVAEIENGIVQTPGVVEILSHVPG